jgi:hypothetical protein
MEAVARTPFVLCTTGTFDGLYDQHLGAPPTFEYVVCAYCGSEKGGTGPGRCHGCGASQWTVRKVKTR